MTIRDPQASETPQTRTTRMADWLCGQLTGHHEHLSGDRVIVMIHGADEGGGVAHDGYDLNDEAMDDMISFVQAVFESRGHSFRVVRMPSPPNRPDAS